MDTDYVLGVNQRISALDIAHREVTAFWASSTTASQGWDHLDILQFWVHPPWTPQPKVMARFLARDTTHHEISEAQSHQGGVWIFMDGSVQDDLSGVAAIFADPHGPLDDITLRFPLGPFQSSTDAELAGIHGALSRLTQTSGWQWATIVTDSHAAIKMIQVTDWRRCRTSVRNIQQCIQALMAQGYQI